MGEGTGDDEGERNVMVSCVKVECVYGRVRRL